MRWRLFGVVFAAAVLVGLAAIVLHCRKGALPDDVAPPLRDAASDVRVRARHAAPAVSAVPKGFASDSVRTICGLDAASADRYEARNDALRSVASRRDLASDDVALLMSYVESTNCILRVEREVALRNDILNLLRNQEPVPSVLEGLQWGPHVIHRICVGGRDGARPSLWRFLDATERVPPCGVSREGRPLCRPYRKGCSGDPIEFVEFA